MIKIQLHRGPDGTGKWIGQVGKAQIGLGHNRLAILDLTAAGHQPMLSACGKHVLLIMAKYTTIRNCVKNWRG
jgi:asparagine synthase (glutamine-hydrolysing)